MTDAFTKFKNLLPELMDEHNPEEVIAEMADFFDSMALMPDVRETSQKYKDLMMAVDILNAAAAGVTLDYGWTGATHSATIRKIAKENFLAQVKTIDEYDYS